MPLKPTPGFHVNWPVSAIELRADRQRPADAVHEGLCGAAGPSHSSTRPISGIAIVMRPSAPGSNVSYAPYGSNPRRPVISARAGWTLRAGSWKLRAGELEAVTPAPFETVK